MESTFLKQQIALSILKTSSNKRLRSLLDNAENLDEFFCERNSAVLPNDIKYAFASKKKRGEALLLAQDYLKYFADDSLDILFFKEKKYPQRLLECQDAPIILYKKGNFDLNASKVVSIVGTRNITSYGRALCENIIASFKGKNILVVSGLAYGVDVYIHELCLKNDIPTVGVLGHGVELMYPAAHRGIAKEMLENGGLISEFLPDTRADKIHFPMRNRIIAGLADATIVVESGARGGSLITAEMANGYNRDVFAFPGSVFQDFSKGCNQLIKQNKAMLINSGDEFLEFMNWNHEVKSKKIVEQPSLFDLAVNLNAQEKEIYTHIKKLKEVRKDDLMFHFKHLSNDLFGILLQLEMSGLVSALPSGVYKAL